MKRIIFVGIHNKPEKPPLCSTTRSGKVIDKATKELKGRYTTFKSNLFDTDHMMPQADFQTFEQWKQRVGYDQTRDIVVLLGESVQRNWRHCFMNRRISERHHNVIPMRHPSSWATKHSTADDWVLDFLIKLEEYEHRQTRTVDFKKRL